MNEIKVLDHGFVKLRNLSGPTRRMSCGPVDDVVVDGSFVTQILNEDLCRYDADDRDPANAARMSFDQTDSERTLEEDMKLAKYLMKNWHCYRKDNEVLTKRGWLKWSDCGEFEYFAIPNPHDKTIKFEKLSVLSFPYKGQMHVVENNRFSISTTPEHTLWVKPRGKEFFRKIKSEDWNHWGHFESFANYDFSEELDFEQFNQWKLVGFYLGDGHHYSKNMATFHLKKERKINYLEKLLNDLAIPYEKSKSESKENAYKYKITYPDFLKAALGDSLTATAKYKNIDTLLVNLSFSQKKGLLEGLINSDGSVKKDRPQIEFGTTSKAMHELFVNCASLVGYECHSVKKQGTMLCSRLYTKDSRTSLEIRKNYFRVETYEDSVYCATSSTGLLIVRGGESSYGFVCGNSSPFEQIQIWLEMKLPIFVARQFVRHRTVRLNEVSGRYVTLPAEWYIPVVIGGKAENNKQGQVNNLDGFVQDHFKCMLRDQCFIGYKRYKQAIDSGVAPEHARMLLSLNHYTHWLWNQDLHNMMHFLSLRMGDHAQVEARAYANAIHKLLSEQLPETMKLFDEYRRLS